ncbi:MAG: hypothetical protein H6985_05355 [Pseudomonadales bacterium]|nr:hypothetical protein [Halioglobus sp.]MCP5128997.1 hypothetical protein [Pseudomonadales bacterium]
MRILSALFAALLALPGLAQTSCFTDPYGKTICSTPDTVVQGNTNSVGSSIYRDDRGNQLQFDSDPTGKSTVQLTSGKPITWSQPVPVQQTRPQIIEPLKLPRQELNPVSPLTRPFLAPYQLPPGQPR